MKYHLKGAKNRGLLFFSSQSRDVISMSYKILAEPNIFLGDGILLDID